MYIIISTQLNTRIECLYYYNNNPHVLAKTLHNDLLEEYKVLQLAWYFPAKFQMVLLSYLKIVQ